MSAPPTAVTAEFPLHLIAPDGDLVPLDAVIRYDSEDPYAVRVAFQTEVPSAEGAESVEWTFARQLLTDGVTQPVGEGDVQVWPAHLEHDSERRQCVCLSLSSPAGAALFEISLPRLVEFLARTYALVPTGCESSFVDLDAEIAMLLWSAAGD